MGSWNSKVTRRRSLKLLGASGLSLGLIAVAGCGGNEEEGGGGGGSGGEGCATPLDAQSTQMRSTLQYVEQSPEADKNCSNCAQYTEGQYGACGGCNVITGPVRPQGYCLSWAAQGEAPAAGEEPAAATEG